MNNIVTRLKNLLFLLKSGRFSQIFGRISFRLRSDSISFGLRRDLSVPFIPPAAQIPLTVRPLEQSDIPKIFDLDKPGLSEEDKQDLLARLEHIHANIPTCYVAASSGNTPAYLQWLMGFEQNLKIQAHFNGIFPLLAPDEALLENAYTLKDFRGKGVMAAAMALLAERGKEIGARYVITFVGQNNVASLKGCKRAGFSPYLLRHEKWSLFRRSLSFVKLPDGTPYPFDAKA